MPILEIWAIVQIGGAIGILPTLALLLLDGFVGAALARSQGRAVWRKFNQALAEGRMPGKEVFDGAAVILGGSLLLAPGFITDLIGFCLLIPPTRAILRRLFSRFVTVRVGAPIRVAGWGQERYRERTGGREFDIEGSGVEVEEASGRPQRSIAPRADVRGEPQ